MATLFSYYGPTHLRTIKGDKSTPGAMLYAVFEEPKLSPTKMDDFIRLRCIPPAIVLCSREI